MGNQNRSKTKLNINEKNIVQRKFNSALCTLDKVEMDTNLNKELSKKKISPAN